MLCVVCVMTLIVVGADIRTHTNDKNDVNILV
jgi:hypothetical protein